MSTNGPATPAASVVICTRNRGSKIKGTVATILECDHPDFELVVIDQSTDDETQQTVESFDDARIVYTRSDTVGTGRSRAIGLGIARAPYVLYTDDDCLVAPDWVTRMVEPFERNDRVGVVFCAVTPLVKEKAEGFTPSFEFDEDSLVTSLWRYYYRHGMGAGMAVRQAAMDEIGGFDTQMGPGSPFMSGEDADIAIRALRADWAVYNTAATTVVHDGLRPWGDYTALAKRDWYSLGATYAKPLRAGEPAAFWITAFQLLYRGLVEPCLPVLRGERPRGFKRFLFLGQGLSAGLRYPLDRDRLLYRDR